MDSVKDKAEKSDSEVERSCLDQPFLKVDKVELRKITIEGTNNRYQVKKAMKTIIKPTKLKIQPTIESKINGYKQQDNKRNIFDCEKFVTIEYVKDLFKITNNICYYCKETVMLDYNIAREMKQWSLDRIDNDKGHNIDNVIIACLECNLKRRRRNMDDFYNIKNMNIIRLE
jgi:hypothetical protein